VKVDMKIAKRKAAMALLHQDTMTVYRQQEVTTDWGGDAFEPVAVYTGIACHLSQKGDYAPAEVTDSTANYRRRLKVFTSSEYDIQPNDILHITHQGDKYVLPAGPAHRYTIHQEIDVKWKGIAEHEDQET